MSALATFRRAMRRYEKRARRVGLATVAIVLRAFRINPPPPDPHPLGYGVRPPAARFLYDRADEALARLRDGLRREQEAAYDDAPPYMCPECYCVGPEPHAPDCDEGAREQPFGDDGDDEPRPGDCEFCGFPVRDGECECDNEDGAVTT